MKIQTPKYNFDAIVAVTPVTMITDTNIRKCAITIVKLFFALWHKTVRVKLAKSMKQSPIDIWSRFFGHIEVYLHVSYEFQGVHQGMKRREFQ